MIPGGYSRMNPRYRKNWISIKRDMMKYSCMS